MGEAPFAEFGAQLKERRKAFGFTQGELAAMVGCAEVTMRKIEAGYLRPSAQVAELLAARLEVPASQRDTFLRLARYDRRRDAALTALSVATASTQSAGSSSSTTASTPSAGVRSERLPGNLPIQLTHLIGRDQEVGQIRSLLLRDEVRLVTLTGPPGIGKTQLAIEVAALLNREDAFSDGIFFVSLAPIREPELVVTTISQAVELDSESSRSLLTLAQWLRDKKTLLLLDNFEHLLGASTSVVEMLSACPYLKVLTTSREALRVRGERVFQVTPLGLPDPDLFASARRADHSANTTAHLSDAALDALSACPAVALMVERAKETNPQFELTKENAQAVAAICASLDGLPLALELIAARLNLLTPPELLRRLGMQAGNQRDMGHELARSGTSEKLRLASGGPRDLPARHQTLRDAIGWSYSLLSPQEQLLFRRLAVFAGGATLTAVEAVCDPIDDLGIGVLEGVSSLLAKNLLKQPFKKQPFNRYNHRQALEETRVEMLETVREYALEKLAESETEGADHEPAFAQSAASAEPESAAPHTGTPRAGGAEIRRWHAEYYLALAEAADPHMSGKDSDVWTRLLDREQDNMRSALAWSLGASEIELAGRLAVALGQYWGAANLTEGNWWLSHILERRSDLSLPLRAMVLQVAGKLLMMSGDLSSASPGKALAQAWDLQQECLAIFDELGNTLARAQVLNNLGTVALRMGEDERARALYEESLELCQELGEQIMTAKVLNNLGEIARTQGDYSRAWTLYEQSLALHRRGDNRWYIASCTHNLGKSALGLGNYALARSLFIKALALYRDMNITWAIGKCLGALGEAEFAEYQACNSSTQLSDAGVPSPLVRVAILFGSAQGIFDSVAYTPEPVDQVGWAMDETRKLLGEEAWQAAWQEGYVMPLDEALQYSQVEEA